MSGRATEGLPGPVVCVCGPTASGKSELAERVALALGSDVISVDAMQVYRGMDVGTAKPPVSERHVPLLMVDVADIDEDYSAARFQRSARELVDKRLEHGVVPVLCGGTGLYLDATIDEMDFPAGSAGDDTRARYERRAAELGPEALWESLRARDPASAALIHPHNTKRVIRALELADEGTSYAERTARLRRRRAHYAARIWGVTRDRTRLYARVDARVDDMLASGLVDEVRALRGRGLAKAPTASQAIGYRELLDYLEGSCTLAEASERIKRRTRHYAKRQLSWLRRDGRARPLDLDTLSVEDAATRIVADVRMEADGEGSDDGTLQTG